MILPINQQLAYFLSTMASGILIGVMVDLYRLSLPRGRRNRILLAVSDLLFWILCTITISFFFMFTNNGNVRFYSLLGFLTGLCLYFPIGSKRLIIAMRVIGRNIVWIIMAIRAIIFRTFIMAGYPVRWMILRLSQALSRKKIRFKQGSDEKNRKW